MKTSSSARKTKHNGRDQWRVCIPQTLQSIHGTTRRFFANKVDAQKFAEELNKARLSWGRKLATLPDEMQGRLWLLVDKYGGVPGLEVALAKTAEKEIKAQTLLTVAIAAHVVDKRADCSPVHVDKAEAILNKFADCNPGKFVSQITPADIANFIANPKWGNTSKRMAHALLQCFFTWACLPGRDMRNDNPCKAVKKHKADNAEIEILTPEQITALLRACHAQDKELLAYFTIGIFAGVRVAEIARLTPELLVGDYIRITEDIGKTGARTVKLNDTCKQWLQVSSTVAWDDLTKRVEAVRAAAGIEWPRNCMRHTHVSMSVPLIGKTMTAENTGHTEAILKKHYLSVMTPEQAAAYMALTPAAVLAQAA